MSDPRGNDPDEAQGDRAEPDDVTRRADAAAMAALGSYLMGVGQSAELPLDSLLLAAFIAAQSRAATRFGGQGRRRSIATIERCLAAVAEAHKEAGLRDPTREVLVRNALSAARRELTLARPEAKPRLGLEQLEHIVRGVSTSSHAGRRDRAVLLVAVAGVLRSAELVRLDVEDLEFVAGGMRVTVRASKSNPRTADATLEVASGDRVEMCAVRALTSWLDAACITAGPIFRRVRAGDMVSPDRLTARSVVAILRGRAEDVGLDSELLTAGDLRSCAVVAAASRGYDERQFARLSRHEDMSMLLGQRSFSSRFDLTPQVLRSSRLRGGERPSPGNDVP